MEEVSQGTLMILISGILVGIAFGFVLWSGRYCMNSAFMDVILMNDCTFFRLPPFVPTCQHLSLLPYSQIYCSLLKSFNAIDFNYNMLRLN